MAKRAKKPLKLTKQQIEAGETPAGGFTKRQLARWGVPWPPPKGWKAALVAGRSVPSAKKSRRRKSIALPRRDAKAVEYAVEAAHRAFDREAARGL